VPQLVVFARSEAPIPQASAGGRAAAGAGQHDPPLRHLAHHHAYDERQRRVVDRATLPGAAQSRLGGCAGRGRAFLGSAGYSWASWLAGYAKPRRTT